MTEPNHTNDDLKRTIREVREEQADAPKESDISNTKGTDCGEPSRQTEQSGQDG